jgi:hypothetical protein
MHEILFIFIRVSRNNSLQLKCESVDWDVAYLNIIHLLLIMNSL